MKWISFVEMKNFKLHRDKRLDFDRHMNIITGESDAGKSTILKAIIKCLYNKPDKKGESFLSWGHKRGDKVEIRVGIKDDDEGRLSPDKSPEVIIERLMGKSNINEYNIYYPNGEVSNYSGFGKKVPPEVVAAHGMREVDMGYGKEQLNYMGQFEGFFLIGKRPEDVATAIGRLAQTEVIDKVKEGLRSDIAINSRSINKNNSEIEGTKESIKEYSYIKEYENKLKRVEKLKEEMETRDEKIGSSTDLSRNIKNSAKNIKDVSEFLSRKIDFEKNIDLIEESVDKLSTNNNISNKIYKPINFTSERVLEVSNTIDSFPDLSTYKDKISHSEWLISLRDVSTEKSKKIKETSKELMENSEKIKKKIPFNEVSTDLSKVENYIRKEKIAKNMLQKVEKVAMDIAKSYVEAKSSKDELSETRSKLKEAMGDRCPVCGGDISGKDIDEMKTHLSEF